MGTNDTTPVNELSNGSLLQPGQSIRPLINTDTARILVQTLYGFKPIELTELNSYDDRNFFVNVSPMYSNKYVECVAQHGYVLKILNSLDSQKHHVEAEHEAMRKLTDQGFVCPLPVLNVHGHDKSIEKIFYENNDNFSSQQAVSGGESYGSHIVRLLTYIPGKILLQVPYTPSLLHSVGKNMGRFERALKDFSHSALLEHETMWSLDNIPKLTQFTYAITNVDDRKLVDEVILAFSSEILPKHHSFTKGAIHGDYNDQNIIVKESDADSTTPYADDSLDYEVYGVIDFGDMTHSYYVYEVAIAIMYAMLNSSVIDPLEVGGHVLAGYLKEVQLNEVEIDSLRVCIAARYAQSLTMGAYSHSLDPTNEYLLHTARNGWKQLRQLWNTSQTDLLDVWSNVMSDSYALTHFGLKI